MDGWLNLARGGSIRGARFLHDVTDEMKHQADILYIILKERLVHQVRSHIPIPECRGHYSLRWIADNFSIFPTLSILAQQPRLETKIALRNHLLILIAVRISGN